MQPKVEIPIEHLWEAFNVDFEKGLLFWKKQVGARAKIGALVGTKDPSGYFRAHLNSQRFLIHRAIWAMKHGEWPQGIVDHINGDPSDNRIINLRLANKSQNNANSSKAQKNNKLGVKGVSFDKKSKKYRADIRKNYKRIHLGWYQTIEEASAAYIAASQHYYGEYSPFTNQRGD